MDDNGLEIELKFILVTSVSIYQKRWLNRATLFFTEWRAERGLPMKPNMLFEDYNK